MSTNASSSKRGFNYQDYVAEGYLFRDAKLLDKVNDEGHDDVDLYYSNGDIYFLQAKETNSAWKYNSSELEKGLRELINKLVDSNPKRIVYVTNDYYPLGKSVKDCDFSAPYQRYDYESLSPSTKKVIKGQISKIANVKDKNNHYKFKYIRDLYINHKRELDQILKPLSIVKFKYDGDGSESKLSRVYHDVKKFLINAKLYGASVDDVLKDMAFVINQSSEDKTKYIDKKRLVSEVFVTAAPEEVFSNKFFDYCTSFDDYLTDPDKQKKLKAMFLGRYDCISSIWGIFKKFSLKNKNIYPNKFEMLKKFVISKEPELTKILGLNYTKNSIFDNKAALKESVEYISWMTIVCHSKLIYLKKAAHYENN